MQTDAAPISFPEAAHLARVPEDALRRAAELRGIAAVTTDNLQPLAAEARKIMAMKAEGLEPVRIWRAAPGGQPPDTPAPAERDRCGSKVKLLWACQAKGIGTAYGVSTHANMMRRELERMGILVYDTNDRFDLAVHFIQPEEFRPIPGKKNLLFATCEMSEPTEPLRAKPDVLVVPCQYNRDVFSRTFNGPIEVCPEGIDPSIYLFHERLPPGPGGKFRFMFCGNMGDSTKGFGLFVSAVETWRRSGRMPAEIEVYLKTTGLQAPPLQFFVILNGVTVGPFPSSIPTNSYPPMLVDLLKRTPKVMWLDNRDLPVHELAALYNSCHALVSPSLGEGFNLVLAEALGTGAPAIWTHHTAMLDYLDESVGFPVTEFKPHVFNPSEPSYFGLAADESAIIARMEEIVGEYPAAIERGRRASERIRGQYTWRLAAERFVKICEAHS